MFLAQCLLHGNHSVNKSNYLFSLLVWHHFPFQVRMKIGVANSFFKGELDQLSTFAKNVFYLVCSIRKECLCLGASSSINTIALLLRLQLNDSPPSWTRAHGILNAGVPYLYSQKMPFYFLRTIMSNQIYSWANFLSWKSWWGELIFHTKNMPTEVKLFTVRLCHWMMTFCRLKLAHRLNVWHLYSRIFQAYLS